MSDTKDESMSYKDYPLNKENPFKLQLVKHMVDNRRDKFKKVITTTGKLIDGESGLAVTEDGEDLLVARTKSVDNEQFVKVYKGAIELMSGISRRASNLFFWYIFPKLESKESMDVIFNLDECMEYCNMSKATVYAGLAELIDCKLIAKGPILWVFYINPVYIFNGNRVTVVEEFKRVGTDKQQHVKKLEEMHDIIEEPMGFKEEPEEGDESDW